MLITDSLGNNSLPHPLKFSQSEHYSACSFTRILTLIYLHVSIGIQYMAGKAGLRDDILSLYNVHCWPEEGRLYLTTDNIHIRISTHKDVGRFSNIST